MRESDMKKGEITIFLSLLFVILMAFTAGILEAAVMQTEKNLYRLEADRAIFSIFGEYQQQLLEEYHVFGLDGSYGTGQYSEKNIIRRMHYYGTEGLEHEITGIQYLTDSRGQPFREQVTEYMEQKYGIRLVKDIVDMTGEWEDQSIQGENMREKEESILDEYRELSQTTEQEETPFSCLETIENSGILSLVLPKDMDLSGKKINLEGQASYRALITGYGSFPARKNLNGAEEKLLFNEYIMDNFGNAADSGRNDELSEEENGQDGKKKNKSLLYEVEYILAGKGSDKENLESVLFKIFLIRMSLNYVYLMGDSSRKSQAETLAVVLSVLMFMPEIAQPLKHLILLAWAAGESIVDLRSLLSGNRVPLIKKSENWQLPLHALFLLGTGTDIVDGTDTQDGISYEDYLRAFLFLENTGDVTMRTLDRTEENLKSIYGLNNFRIDYCITKLELNTKAAVTGGLSYRFPVYFGYE